MYEEQLINNSLENLTINENKNQLTSLQREHMPWQGKVQKVTQYKQLYFSRLMKFKKRFPSIKLTTISALESHVMSTVCGIIKRIQINRVRPFEQFYHTKYNNSNPIYSDNDDLQVEDTEGKIKLKLTNRTQINGRKVMNRQLPYGIVLAVRGKLLQNSSIFGVYQFIMPALAPQKLLKLQKIGQQQILVISQNKIIKVLNSLKILNKTSFNILHISAIIIIGGFQLTANELSEVDKILQQMKQIDIFFIPSTNNSRQSLYPMKPYNQILFPRSKNNPSINLCCNPQYLGFYNMLILVSCGANYQDMMLNCDIGTPYQYAQKMLEYSHLCPSSPFSLQSQPYVQDNLVIDKLPHLFIQGKSPVYSSQTFIKEDKSTTIVTLPNQFTVLINLRNRESHNFEFKLSD